MDEVRNIENTDENHQVIDTNDEINQDDYIHEPEIILDTYDGDEIQPLVNNDDDPTGYVKNNNHHLILKHTSFNNRIKYYQINFDPAFDSVENFFLYMEENLGHIFPYRLPYRL